MIIVLTGPTGGGKSDLAFALAKRMDGEIVNGDAFQVYKELLIATACPSKEERMQVPSHLFQYVSVAEQYDVARYQKDCRRVIEEILSRGKTPIIVGGSGLYIRSALYDYSFDVDTSSVDMSKYGEMDDESLHEELRKLDEKEAEKIPFQNRRRVLRAISIILASGKSKTELIAEQNHEPIWDTRFFVLDLPNEELYSRIDMRVEKMFLSGIEEEVIPLLKRHGYSLPSLQAIGVKEFVPYLEGKASIEEVKEAIKLDTKHYVKRQRTFYRHQFPYKEIKTVEDIQEGIK